jgi:hypothetical protein
MDRDLSGHWSVVHLRTNERFISTPNIMKGKLC